MAATFAFLNLQLLSCTVIKRDYHGWTVTSAEVDVEDVISYVRMNKANRESTEDAEFIVGHGPIREKVIEVLKWNGCSPRPKLGNDGVIVCVIE